ncbi:MAG: hypothetical protein ACI9V8_001867 [Urechidicola sp.]|jgi:hypothetical protein
MDMNRHQTCVRPVKVVKLSNGYLLIGILSSKFRIVMDAEAKGTFVTGLFSLDFYPTLP